MGNFRITEIQRNILTNKLIAEKADLTHLRNLKGRRISLEATRNIAGNDVQISSHATYLSNLGNNLSGPLIIHLTGWSSGIDLVIPTFKYDKWTKDYNGTVIAISGTENVTAGMFGGFIPESYVLTPPWENRADLITPDDSDIVTAALTYAQQLLPPSATFSHIKLVGVSNGANLVQSMWSNDVITWADQYICVSPVDKLVSERTIDNKELVIFTNENDSISGPGPSNALADLNTTFGVNYYTANAGVTTALPSPYSVISQKLTTHTATGKSSVLHYALTDSRPESYFPANTYCAFALPTYHLATNAIEGNEQIATYFSFLDGYITVAVSVFINV